MRSSLHDDILIGVDRYEWAQVRVDKGKGVEIGVASSDYLAVEIIVDEDSDCVSGSVVNGVFYAIGCKDEIASVWELIASDCDSIAEALALQLSELLLLLLLLTKNKKGHFRKH